MIRLVSFGGNTTDCASILEKIYPFYYNKHQEGLLRSPEHGSVRKSVELVVLIVEHRKLQ